MKRKTNKKAASASAKQIIPEVVYQLDKEQTINLIGELIRKIAEPVPIQNEPKTDISDEKMALIMSKIAEIKKIMLMKQKQVLSLEEAAQFLGVSKSYMYKLTSVRTVPFSKPNGGTLFFDKEELTNWALGKKSIKPEK